MRCSLYIVDFFHFVEFDLFYQRYLRGGPKATNPWSYQFQASPQFCTKDAHPRGLSVVNSDVAHVRRGTPHTTLKNAPLGSGCRFQEENEVRTQNLACSGIASWLKVFLVIAWTSRTPPGPSLRIVRINTLTSSNRTH